MRWLWFIVIRVILVRNVLDLFGKIYDEWFECKGIGKKDGPGKVLGKEDCKRIVRS